MNNEFPILRKQNHKRIDWSKEQPIHGLDTETYKGKAILLADESRYIEPDSFSDILEFLNSKKYRNSYNFFYNIKFDFGALLKWLGEEDLDLFEQIIFNKVGVYKEQYSIYYLPNKVFSIRNHKNKVQFYDLTNFYEGKLDFNAKQYLDKQKLSTIDANRINIDKKYYYFNREKIIEYCMIDAILTKRLGEHLQNVYFTMLGIHPKDYISVASVGANYFRQECYIPSINELNPKMLEYWWKSYIGGRFEVMKKGFFPKVYDYDLISAYPATIANLINIKQGEWKKVGELHPKAYYGVYECYVFSHYPNLIPPLGIKVMNTTMFPNGELGILYLTKQEIEYIWNEHPELAAVKVFSGWEFTPKKLIYPFKDIISKLVYKKQEAKEKYGTESMEYIIPKKTGNSFYGKQLNVNEGVIGKFWNIIYGSLITADTRLKVLDLAIQAKEHLISIETDGVFTDKKLNVTLGKELGDWELTSAENQIIISNGVFTNSVKKRTRGFPRNRTNLEEIIRTHPNDTKVIQKFSKPITLKEAFIQNKFTWKDINVWKKTDRTINANSDKKRKWERYDYSFKDLSENQYVSRPWWDAELGLGYIPKVI